MDRRMRWTDTAKYRVACPRLKRLQTWTMSDSRLIIIGLGFPLLSNYWWWMSQSAPVNNVNSIQTKAIPAYQSQVSLNKNSDMGAMSGVDSHMSIRGPGLSWRDMDGAWKTWKWLEMSVISYKTAGRGWEEICRVECTFTLVGDMNYIDFDLRGLSWSHVLTNWYHANDLMLVTTDFRPDRADRVIGW